MLRQSKDISFKSCSNAKQNIHKVRNFNAIYFFSK